MPFLRGPARLAEALAILPELRRKLPEARLPFERPAVVAAMLAASVAVRGVRESRHLRPAAKELLSGLLSLAPAASRCAAASSPPTTAPSTSRSARTSTARRATKEHERCGSHLIGPLLVASAIGNVLAAPAPARLREPARRALGSVGRSAVDRDLRLDDAPPRQPRRSGAFEARPRAAAPVLDRRAVARAARGRRGRARAPVWSSRMATEQRTRRLPPEIFDLPVEKMREGYYTDAYFNHTRERCSRTVAGRAS